MLRPYQSACEIDAGGAGVGAVHPLRLGEAEEPVAGHVVGHQVGGAACELVLVLVGGGSVECRVSEVWDAVEL